MFQKISKHRANDASNDVHRPPLPPSYNLSILWISKSETKRFCVAQDIFTLPISFQEVKDRLAENFKGETHVAEVVEAVEHSHAKVLPLWVL